MIPGVTFTWSSSDENVATVNSSGLVTAVADGTSTITATAGGIDGTALITVTLPGQTIFSDDFESGSLNPDWTEVENFEVIQDPTGKRQYFVASVVNITQLAFMVKQDLSLGPDTIAHVFFYDYGVQDGDDHSAGIDGELGSIGILARFRSESPLDSDSFYIFDPGGTTIITDIPRTIGWHEFRFEITSTGTSAFIDGTFVGTVPDIIAAEMFWIESEGGNMALWDDIAITGLP